MRKTIIKAENLTKIYKDGQNEIKALDDLNFSFYEGEFVVILGPSGAGKSTLLHILGGMEKPTSGRFYLNNNEISKYSDKKLGLFRRFEIGFVFQFYNLIPNLNALENVSLAASISKNPLNSKDVLDAVGLSDRIMQFPSTLSGGEQQRVAIARAIVKRPTLLLCDEPTGALDSKTGVDILKLLKKISKEDNKTVVVVTHNQTIAEIADHLIMVKDGKIVEDKTITNPKRIDELEW